MARKQDGAPQQFLLELIKSMEARVLEQGRAGLPALPADGSLPPGSIRKRVKPWRAMRAELAGEGGDGSERVDTSYRPRRRRR